MNKENNSKSMVESKTIIICPSPNGRKIAEKLKRALSATLYIKENGYSLEDKNFIEAETNEVSLDKDKKEANGKYICKYTEEFRLYDISREAMKNFNSVIFISSIGIAVRAIAPFIKRKEMDPGVVVVDLSCKYAINILSGHLGGGNELTHNVSEILNIVPIITTASDNMGIIAPDVLAKQNGLIIEDLKKAKHIASLLVDKKIVGIKDDYGTVKISKGYESINQLRDNCIWITHNIKADFQKNIDKELDYFKVLRLIKKDIVLGIGCRRDTPYEKLEKFVNDLLSKYNLDKRSIANIVSIDVKANEKGIIRLAENFNCAFNTFSVEEIKTVQDKYEKSEFVLKTIGVTGVCEPCVDLAGAKVIRSKIKYEGMTLAIGVLKDNL